MSDTADIIGAGTTAKKRNGKVVALLIERDNAQIFVPVRVG